MISWIYLIIIKNDTILSMPSNILNLDSAMNMIKENLVRDLSDSVTKSNKNCGNILKNVSFSEKDAN